MRVINIQGTKVELSKSEARQVSRLEAMNASRRYGEWLLWHDDAPSQEARDRRQQVAYALKLIDPPIADNA